MMPTPNRGELADAFADPPAEYGPIDGWWWEAGQLDREKLRWQLEELKDKGISGTWFYARYLYGEPLGSQPGYMTEGWWDFTRFVAQESRRLGMLDWFSNWTALQFEQDAIRAQREAEPELWGRRLTIHRGEPQDDGAIVVDVRPQDEVIDAAAYRVAADVIDHDSRVDLNDAVEGGSLSWTAPDPGWEVAVVAARPWDLDYLGAEVGRRWTDVILGEYERHLPGLLGDAVQAFGPDELALLNGTTVYSPEVLERLSGTLGQDARPYLVGMFLDIGLQTERVRTNYHETVAALLDERFYHAPTRWLHDRGMQHVSLSQLNDDAITHVFHHGDFFRYLRSFDAPGNEDPLATGPGERRLFRTKISSSVAHLYGRQRVVLLAHYASGWGHTLEENVGWTNEAYAKGLNLYSRHLGSYSLLGGWYEYVPPHDHFFHPTWRYWKTFADYVRRLSYVMSQGVHHADVAILYPLTTLHAHWRAIPEATEPDGDGEQRISFEAEAAQRVFEPFAFEASRALEELSTAVYHGGLDFDFVDDPSFDRALVRGEVLAVGELEFRSVVLPPMTTIRRSTMVKIAAFHAAGGTVVALGRLPSASVEAGRDDPELQALVEEVFGPSGRGVLVEREPAEVVEAVSSRIERDVVASEPMVFHTHQHLDDAEVYLVFNASDTARDITIDLRSEDNPSIWDCFAGEIHPAHRVTRRDGRTQVDLLMGPSEAVVLVVGAGAGGPVVEETDLAEVTEVTETPEVRGFAGSGGTKHATVRQSGGSSTALEAEVEAPPEPIDLAGPFSFRLEPTMDNRWGDFRYPASDAVIGAEARRFRYREEINTSGTDAGWHQAGFDDGDWDEVAYSHGPYWWHLGPFASDDEPDGLLERALEGDRDLGWKRYSFSKQFGTDRQIGYQGFMGWFRHLLGVSDNFVVLDDAPTGDAEHDHHHYLSTTVILPTDGRYTLRLGRTQNHPELSGFAQDAWMPYRVAPRTQAWVDGQEVLSVADGDAADVSVDLSLHQGPNRVLLRIVHEAGAHLSSYAVLLDGEPKDTEPQVPELRWYRRSPGPVLDVEPDRKQPVGWYRFTAPPGVRRISFHANGRAVEAWVDGEAVAVTDGAIELDRPPSGPSTVALRVEQERGTYAGAVFDKPIRFDCDEGRIAVGDWSEQGLATYSGIGVYGMDVDLTADHISSKVILHLGRAKAVAEVIVNGQQAAVLLGRPYTVDITALVREGPNRIEVKVANTLANHMSTYPTRWVFEGQTVSGLLGPVQLRFLSPVRLRAKTPG
jgi:glycosyl hydrolase family 106( putative alpha-L-rhamnosidase)